MIEPPWPEYLLGDPSVVKRDESPDDRWHLFANTLTGIQHYTGSDGIHWKREGKIFPGFRAFVYSEDGLYYLLYEEFTVPQFRSRVSVRTSRDLKSWSKQTVLLGPSYGWEGKISKNAGNPCLIKVEDRYRLYYSAGVVFLKELGFCEPRYIGIAHSDKVTGPYLKDPKPIISPSSGEPYRNLGAGAIKVTYDEKRKLFYGFNNGIYSDEEGRTRSAILLLSSKDGRSWKKVYDEPIICPEGNGWKKALVYQLDVVRVQKEMWLYYNARSGWRFGKERIGLATCRM